MIDSILQIKTIFYSISYQNHFLNVLFTFLVPRNVVLFRNGKKSYGAGKNRKEILKDINMTVAEGSM